MWTHSGPLIKIDHEKLSYDIDTMPGNSGSPIWVHYPGIGHFVIGVHSQGGNTVNSGCRLSVKKVKILQEFIEQTHEIEGIIQKFQDKKDQIRSGISRFNSAKSEIDNLEENKNDFDDKTKSDDNPGILNNIDKVKSKIIKKNRKNDDQKSLGNQINFEMFIQLKINIICSIHSKFLE